VQRILAIGCGLESTRTTLAIAAGHEGVSVAAGVHPHQAADGERLDGLLDERIVAVGEIGLDFYRDYAPRDVQRQVFAAQLELAEEHGKPVIIHSRTADDETAAALERFSGTVVLHCFSSPGLLSVALDRGYYVSFAGNVTYPKATELRDAARAVPAERILAETDCPYLAPQPVRGKRNEPAYVVHTVASLAETRGDDPDELGRRIDDNAATAFRLT